MFEQKFRKVERVLRPRKAIKHSEAIDILATVVKEADAEIEQLEEENVLYKTWLIISIMVMVMQGVALLLDL